MVLNDPRDNISDALVLMKVAPANLYEISVSLEFLTYMRAWLVMFDFFAIPWTAACQAPLSMGFFQARVLELGCHFLLQRIFPTQGSNPGLLHWQADSLLLSHQGSPLNC